MATGYEDDVPPLEDFSELIGQITLDCTQEKSQKTSAIVSDIPQRDKKLESFGNVTTLGADGDIYTKTCQKEKSNDKSKVETFGGFKRGFLNKQKANSHENNVSQAKPDEEIPTIKPKDSAANNLRISEVQEAMKTSSFLQNKDWITEDFLKKLEDRPDLLKKLADPRYSKALDHFTSNPQEACRQGVSDNKELQSFIKDLCGLLGEHFTAMAEQVHQSRSDIDKEKPVNSTAPTADEEKMAEILSDPETMNALKDPWISKLIANLKNNPPEARRMLATSRPEVLPKIKKLVDAGILSFG